METPTPLQKQIEYLVTNGRGYTPQITPTVFSRLSEKMYLIDFYAALEQQRLQDALGSMERQQSSPTLDALFTSDLDRILRSTARPGSDIEFIKNDYHEDLRKFFKITPLKNFEFLPLKERLPNKQFDEIDPFPKKGANAGHEVPLDPDTLRAYRAKLLAMGLNPFAVDQPPRRVYDIFSSDPKLSLPDPGKNWEFPHPSIPPEKEFPYLRQPEKEFPFKKPWKHPQDDDLRSPLRQHKEKEFPYLRQPEREFPRKPKELPDSLYIIPPPKPISNPVPEPLDSQDPLDEFLKRFDQENRKKDSKKKWIE